MAKYIDADALVEVVKEAEQAGRVDVFSDGFRSQCFDEVLDCIRNSPTVDAVPVVRCKDCKECKARINGTFDCEFHYEALSDLNGYCNYGKAKQERKNEKLK